MEINDDIKRRLGNWWPLFLPFIQSQKWDDIFANIKMQAQANRIIIPKSVDLFKSFELVDRQKLKAIVVLMDPYPSFTKDGVMIANGVPMSCANTGALQPSLELWYTGMEEAYFGFDPDFDKRPDNSYLLKEEHVMLLNTALTVERDKVGSHSQIWLPFMKFFIEEVINKHYRGLPIVLCGQAAQKLEKFFDPMLHYIKKIEHPVAASYQNRAWKHEDVFEWVNNIIRNNNGKEEEIRWYRKKGEHKKEEEWPDWVLPNEPPVQEEVKKPPVQSFNSGEKLKSARELGLPWDD